MLVRGGLDKTAVAPARERGLKYFCTIFVIISMSRSREGAWIEIRKN